MPKVSICLVTYNRADVLSQTIDSILNQSYSDFELIISDDNSSDETRNVCEYYQQKDNRVRYYCNEHNFKMPGNLNAAISRATGEYIADLHDGDVYKPLLIEKWVHALDTFPDALFVFNGYEIIDNDGKSDNFIHSDFEDINDGAKLMEYFQRTFTSAPWGTVMVRRMAYERFGFFNPVYGFLSDVEMWLRLGYMGKVAYIKEPLITLAQRDKTRFYYFPDWDIIRINFNILKIYYNIFNLKEQSPSQINRRIIKNIARNFLILLKYKQWDRVKQGFEIFAGSPYLILRFIGLVSRLYKPQLTRIKVTQFWLDVLIE